TRFSRDWSSDVCSSDLATTGGVRTAALPGHARRNEFVSLTVDARLGHAYVAAGGLNVADVRLATAGVRTHNLAGSRTTAMLKKRSEERRVGKEGRGGWA